MLLKTNTSEMEQQQPQGGNFNARDLLVLIETTLGEAGDGDVGFDPTAFLHELQHHAKPPFLNLLSYKASVGGLEPTSCRRWGWGPVPANSCEPSPTAAAAAAASHPPQRGTATKIATNSDTPAWSHAALAGPQPRSAGRGAVVPPDDAGGAGGVGS